jgi:glycosyltransferase involved in cell wall biosynthesis
LEERGQEQSFRIITHTRFFLTSLIWWLFARKNKIKWIHIEHWSDYVKLNSNFKNLVAKIYDKLIWKWIFKKADKLVWVSNACKSFIQKNFVDREVKIVYRGVKLKEKNIKKKWEIKLVFIGRLVKLKWVDYLLEAFNNLKINNKLIIIWDWEEKENLEKFVKENNNIEFLGFKNKDFIENFLAENNCILINSSYQEWLPTTVIEGLFYKNVVIASNVWWTSEISDKKDLILFEAWDKKQLEEKIIFAIKNYNDLKWLSFNGIKEKFSWEENILKYYKILNER